MPWLRMFLSHYSKEGEFVGTTWRKIPRIKRSWSSSTNHRLFLLWIQLFGDFEKDYISQNNWRQCLGCGGKWVVKNATKWPDCRISGISSGLQGIENDGSSNSSAVLTTLNQYDERGGVCEGKVYSRAKTPLPIGKDGRASLVKSTGLLSNSEGGFVVCACVVEGRPQSIGPGASNCRVSQLECPGVGQG